MRIRFIGPLDRVTGSCYELRDAMLGVHFLVDCGMVQGEPNADQANRAPFPFEPSELDFVLLTHAHLDHCGLIPRLYREGFEGTVYCTKETMQLARVVLRDAVKNGAPYRPADIKSIKWHEHEIALFGGFCPLHTDLFLQYHRAGHIPGAVSFTLRWGPPPKSSRPGPRGGIHFSGDLGPNPEGAESQPLTGHRMQLGHVDYAVMESTYGGTRREPEHESPERRLDALAEALRSATEQDGVVILPAFAVSRTQDVLFDLHVLMSRHEDLARLPVWLDAPMGQRVNKVYAKALTRTYITGKGKVRPAWLGRGAFRMLGLDPHDPTHEAALFDALRELLVEDHQPSKDRPEALRNWRRRWQTLPNEQRSDLSGPAIVLTGGGMCEGGPVLEHLARWLPDERTTVLFTGYCSAQSIGGQLLRLGEMSPMNRARLQRRLQLGTHSLSAADIRARIARISGYSAHADQRGLLDWVFGPKLNGSGPAARTIFLAHGDPAPRRDLQAALEARGAELNQPVTVHLPSTPSAWFNLDTGRWLEGQVDNETLLRARVAALERLLAAQGRVL